MSIKFPVLILAYSCAFIFFFTAFTLGDVKFLDTKYPYCKTIANTGNSIIIKKVELKRKIDTLKAQKLLLTNNYGTIEQVKEKVNYYSKLKSKDPENQEIAEIYKSYLKFYQSFESLEQTIQSGEKTLVDLETRIALYTSSLETCEERVKETQ